jgi:hypothetical protein
MLIIALSSEGLNKFSTERHILFGLYESRRQLKALRFLYTQTVLVLDLDAVVA